MLSRTKTYALISAVVFLGVTYSARHASAFSYIFAGEANGVDVITHPLGYTPSGGTLSITVGIDPLSPNAPSMVISTQNVIDTWNGLVATTGNLALDTSNNIPSGYDFESTLLHEMGHSLGLGHINAASESGLTDANQNYTKATNGVNNVFDIDDGVDNIIGSADDIRGDDINLNYFRTDDNDPFDISLGVIDSTTYSRNVADLPGADTFSANADRTVGNALGYANTEAVMQQGTFWDEAQRTLGADDVAGIRYAMTGLDELANTADDYSIDLSYAGLTTSADIVVKFDDSETGFAVSKSDGVFMSADHIRISSTAIYFNTSPTWFFNDVAFSAVPEPGSVALMCVAGIGVLAVRFRYRRKKR